MGMADHLQIFFGFVPIQSKGKCLKERQGAIVYGWTMLLAVILVGLHRIPLILNRSFPHISPNGVTKSVQITGLSSLHR